MDDSSGDKQSLTKSLVESAIPAVAGLVEKFGYAIGGKALASRISDLNEVRFRSHQRLLIEGRQTQRQIAYDDVTHEAALRLRQAAIDIVVEREERRLRALAETLAQFGAITHQQGDEDELSPPPDDWIQRWRSYAEETTDAHMQRLWAYILRSGSKIDSTRPSYIALDALRFFDSGLAETFIILCKRMVFSDRILSDEIPLLQPNKPDTEQQVAMLADLRIVETVQSASKFSQIMGLTVNMQEDTYTASDDLRTLELSATGKELAESFIENWKRKWSHYKRLRRRNIDANEVCVFEPSDGQFILDIFKYLGLVGTKRFKSGTNTLYLRNVRDDDHSVVLFEKSSNSPFSQKAKYDITYVEKFLTPFEQLCVKSFYVGVSSALLE